MALELTFDEQVARVRSDLRMGAAVILRMGRRSVLAASAETITSDRLADFRDVNADLTLAITARRAETLRARAYDGDLARIAVPQDADLRWVRAIADPSDDLRAPMKGPCKTLRGGDPHLHRVALALCKQARLLPAAVLVQVKAPAKLAVATGIAVLDVSGFDIETPARSPLTEIANARLPMEVAQAGRLHIFRPSDGGEEHYAVEIGRPRRDSPVLVRLHSACFTGDLLGSLKCDCGPQLRAAMAQIADKSEGVLLYLNQEGRGIGLANKMRAYSLQDQGFDTVEANHRLGFEDDERDFRIGAEILRKMGFSGVDLMTNNPRKVEKLAECGLTVTSRVPLRVGKNPLNADYLATKAKKSGHIL